MCLLCNYNNDFSEEHIQIEIGKSSLDKLNETCQKVKQAKKQYQIWLNSEHMSGYEKSSIENTLKNLNQMQFCLNKVL